MKSWLKSSSQDMHPKLNSGTTQMDLIGNHTSSIYGENSSRLYFTSPSIPMETLITLSVGHLHGGKSNDNYASWIITLGVTFVLLLLLRTVLSRLADTPQKYSPQQRVGRYTAEVLTTEVALALHRSSTHHRSEGGANCTAYSPQKAPSLCTARLDVFEAMMQLSETILPMSSYLPY